MTKKKTVVDIYRHLGKLVVATPTHHRYFLKMFKLLRVAIEMYKIKIEHNNLVKQHASLTN